MIWLRAGFEYKKVIQSAANYLTVDEQQIDSAKLMNIQCDEGQRCVCLRPCPVPAPCAACDITKVWV